MSKAQTGLHKITKRTSQPINLCDNDNLTFLPLTIPGNKTECWFEDEKKRNKNEKSEVFEERRQKQNWARRASYESLFDGLRGQTASTSSHDVKEALSKDSLT